MSGLKQFTALVKDALTGNVEEDEITQRVEKLVSEFPGEAESYFSMIEKYHRKKPLPGGIYIAIVGPLEQTLSARANNDEISIDDEETVISTSTSVTPSADQTDTTSTEYDEETVINPPVGKDADATVFNDNTVGSTTATGTTGTTGGFAIGSSSDRVGPGTTLKGRFVLMELLGKGGMGEVYKAQDLLKVEARDRNPYVAIKILGEAFAQHPEAFIALQREASKAQRLAHPNIGTVFDFDREGATIYMTMQLLEGQELKDFIKKLPPEAMSFEDAFPLIEGLSGALMYAHDNGLIHSDFKPGNCFITHDLDIKVIDFGIARASATGDSEEGETTVFDPGELGALTPAYATIEMFEGLPPHPSDDLYALGCIAFELLTGKHPYDKKSAPKALEAGMKPAPFPPKKITKRQEKAIYNAIALERVKRTQTVAEFIDEFKPRKSFVKQIAMVSVVVLLVVAGLAYKPINDYFIDQENQALIARLQATNVSEQKAAIGELFGIENETVRARIALAARDEVQAYYEKSVKGLFEPEQEHYAYPAAKQVLKQAAILYPDSALINELGVSLDEKVSFLNDELRERFDMVIAEKRIVSDPDADDLPEVLAIVKTAIPSSEMLRSADVENSYRQMANTVLAQGNLEMAQSVIDTGLAQLNGNSKLLELRDSLERKKIIRNRDALASSLEKSLGALKLATLADADGSLNDIARLRNVKAGSRILAKVEKSLKGKFKNEFSTALSGEASGAEALLLKYAIALNPKDLTSYRAELTARSGSISSALESEKSVLDSILAKAANTGDWYEELGNQLARLVAVHPNGVGGLSVEYKKTSNTLASLVDGLATQNRYLGATMAIEEGMGLLPGNENLARVSVELQEREQAYRDEQAAKAKALRIAEFKEMLNSAANKGSEKQAQSIYNELSKELGQNAAYMSGEGKQKLALAYGTAAQSRAAAGKYASALALIVKSQALEPKSTQWFAKYAEYKAASLAQSISTTVKNSNTFNTAKVRGDIKQLHKLESSKKSERESAWIAILSERIKKAESKDIYFAHNLMSQAKGLFSGNKELSALKIKPLPKPSVYAKVGLALVQKAKLTAASAELKKANSSEPNHSDTAALTKMLARQKAEAQAIHAVFRKNYDMGKYDLAKSELGKLLSAWSDNPAFTIEKQRMAKIDLGARPCIASFAGKGKIGRAQCYDLVKGKSRGPTMVVVKHSSGPFAIGKYETSISDWNKYCKLSGECSAIAGDSSLPVTGISTSSVSKYAAWLSKQTGYSYSLPTLSQWKFASGAAGKEGNNDYNCLMRLGTQVVKGVSMLSVKSGQANRWGVVNYVGNAQEMVVDGGAIKAAGGHFQDNMSSCNTRLIKAAPPAGDKMTTFRLIRKV